MRIAVPTDDGVTIAQHFGRSAAFLVFEVENKVIQSRETRPNGMHKSDDGHQCAHGEGHTGHSHSPIVDALAGCQVVLCGGMGGRAAEALGAAGISAIMVAPLGTAEETVAAWLGGTLPQAPGGFCRCH